jgi:N-acetylglutamate synthase-like GNAT family acetyltransferase
MIRQASTSDSQSILELLTQLGYNSLSTDDVIRKINSYTQAYHQVLVMEIHEHVVGFISLHCYESFHSEGKIGRITAFCIHRDYHEKGYGKGLLKAAEKYFVDTGCTKAEVTSNMRRTQAHDFYLSQGYIENSRKFVKSLL